MTNDPRILQYAAPEAKKSAYWLICFCLATLHLSALLPLGMWIAYVAFGTALFEIDWAALSWPQRLTFAPWQMLLPQLLSVVAGVITWSCIWSKWRERTAGRRLVAAIAVQVFVALFFIASGLYLVKLGWLPLRDSAQARVLSEEIPIAFLLQGLIALPMLAFALHPAGRRRDNQTLQWTRPASSVLLK